MTRSCQSSVATYSNFVAVSSKISRQPPPRRLLRRMTAAIAGIPRALEHQLLIAVGWCKRRLETLAVHQQLSVLDDQTLRDIGMHRSMLPAIAERMVAGGRGRARR